VSAFVTHAIFPKQTWKKFVDTDIFENFWVRIRRIIILDYLIASDNQVFQK
jgi:hypothetical protein